MRRKKVMQKIHLKAPDNWINDPNGFIYYQGTYHLFYQYFPYEPRWGTMHWGHAVSKDLVNWDHLNIALYPSKYDDRNGCFSGSAMEHEGELYIYYTGVRYVEEDPENTTLCLNDDFISSQMMVTSKDGFHFDNIHDKRTIIPPICDWSIGDKKHTRDPKVWRGENAWYMVLGSRTEEERGKLLFYRSKDLYNWEWVNSAEKDKGFGWMWECPDYFEVEGGKVLIFSPMGFLKDGRKEENHAICTIVDFEEGTCTMDIPDEYQFLDYGLDLYAPQSTLDEWGRRVMVAWARMPEPVDGSWSGIFCIPRIVEVENGHIYFRVHPNIKKAYAKKISLLSQASEAGYKLELEMGEDEEINIGGYKIFRQGNEIHTDKSEVFPGDEDSRLQFHTPELKEGYHVEVYVSDNLIEVYVNQGEYVITNAVYGLSDKIQTNHRGELAIYTVE